MWIPVSHRCRILGCRLMPKFGRGRISNTPFSAAFPLSYFRQPRVSVLALLVARYFRGSTQESCNRWKGDYLLLYDVLILIANSLGLSWSLEHFFFDLSPTVFITNNSDSRYYHLQKRLTTFFNLPEFSAWSFCEKLVLMTHILHLGTSRWLQRC